MITMSNPNLRLSGSERKRGARRATEADPRTGRGGKGRRLAKCKARAVTELLRDCALEYFSGHYFVTAATLSVWRNAFPETEYAKLGVRRETLINEQALGQVRYRRVLVMGNELLRERFSVLEDDKPLLPRRSER